jgi:hypothetical protein
VYPALQASLRELMDRVIPTGASNAIVGGLPIAKPEENASITNGWKNATLETSGGLMVNVYQVVQSSAIVVDLPIAKQEENVSTMYG